MTTRTLTVQADRRAYLPHVVCVVKKNVTAEKNVLVGWSICTTRARSA